MSPLLLHDLLAALALLHSGRAHDAAEALSEAIREHGGFPIPDAPEPKKPPIWMQRNHDIN